MKAVVYREYGGPSVLQMKEIERPIPGDKEILVRVLYSTVSAGAVWLRKGMFPGSIFFTMLLRCRFGISRPRFPVLGAEFSGVVEETGKEVTAYKKGDAVYGTTTGLKSGAYAHYVCIPEKWSEGLITFKPKELTFQEAAALPVGGMTALHLLLKAKIKQGDRVLIYGASGSVGTYAVQIAAYFGAEITAACSDSNKELVASLGAEHVIDYRTENIFNPRKKFDIVFDAVGKLPDTVKNILDSNGRFCSVKSLTTEKQDYLRLLHKMIDDGKLKPVIDRKYQLEQIAEAHGYVDTGRKKGNVVIEIT